MATSSQGESVRQAKLLAQVLPELVAAGLPSEDDLDAIVRWRETVGLDDPNISEAVLTELRPLLKRHPDLRLTASPTDEERQRFALALSNGGSHTRQALWMLLSGPPDRPPSQRQVERALRLRRRREGLIPSGWLARQIVGFVLNTIIVACIAGGAVVVWFTEQEPNPTTLGPLMLRIFAVWVLTFVPGWMFVRFIGQRATALWDEYVINLHRLGWDAPENLPRPPRSSEFHQRWVENGGEVRARNRSLYREKFDAYYGRSVSGSAQDRVHRVKAETLFPVFLLTAVLAVCWTAVLWNLATLDVSGSANNLSLWASLAFAFLGAYSFGIQMLVRRFFQSDLRASAYASLVLRVIVVLVLVVALHPLLEKMNLDAATQTATMYIVGFFPLVGLQAMQRVVAVVFRIVVPSLRADYPLSDLDGLSIWYESRLLEEGVEDMQNLATANLVDILLHTRVPVGRLVDWVDQAHLLLHLDRSEQGVVEKVSDSWAKFRNKASRPAPAKDAKSDTATPDGSVGDDEQHGRYGTKTRHALRCLGIRRATDLLTAFPAAEMDSGERSLTTERALQVLTKRGVDEATVLVLVRILSNESSLNPVRNWQSHEVRYHPSAAT
jgi:hypothetical protein